MLPVSAVNGDDRFRPPLVLLGALVLLVFFAMPLRAAGVTTGMPGNNNGKTSGTVTLRVYAEGGGCKIAALC